MMTVFLGFPVASLIIATLQLVHMVSSKGHEHFKSFNVLFFIKKITVLHSDMLKTKILLAYWQDMSP